MRTSKLVVALSLLSSSLVSAAAQWHFQDATVAVSSKDSQGTKQTLSEKAALTAPVVLAAGSSLKLFLTTTENSSPKRPHQAALVLLDTSTGLETSYSLSVQENGKAKLEIAQKDLPTQFLLPTADLKASILLGSFGSAKSLDTPLFTLSIELDPMGQVHYQKPLRYGKKEEIRHIFRPEATSPPVVVSLFFVLAIAATLPVLGGAWFYLGANLDDVASAIGAAPVSYTMYVGSIVAMEGLFFLYYYSWNLFQVLPVAGLISVVTVLSGSKALSEVQSRRMAGSR